MGKYFGTDGFRGEINSALNPSHAYKIGRFLAYHLKTGVKGDTLTHPKILIGKDPRRSSYSLEYAIASGIAASGVDAYLLHVTTTPSVSYVTSTYGFDYGIMITASHNPHFDNGIKIIDKDGRKLDDATTMRIEEYIDGKCADIPYASADDIGKITDYLQGRKKYARHLASVIQSKLTNMRIGLDCANGAAWSIAPDVFSSLGAQVNAICCEPDGLNINDRCGSTHIERMCELVTRECLDVGFAFDGDGDRCIASDENGKVVDGDKILYILARRAIRENCLDKNTVVITSMSNGGLIDSLKDLGVNTEITSVGDKYVWECIEKNGYSLGGEQSGHIIVRKHSSTGDGILTALLLCDEMQSTGLTLSELCQGMRVYPQYSESIYVKNKDMTVTDPRLTSLVKTFEDCSGGHGRIMIRASGTEAKVRIMVENESDITAKKYMRAIMNLITEMENSK